jgi:hypothetical protein
MARSDLEKLTGVVGRAPVTVVGLSHGIVPLCTTPQDVSETVRRRKSKNENARAIV